MERRARDRSDLEHHAHSASAPGASAAAAGAGGYGPQDDGDSIAAIHRALELGVNWIDTAADLRRRATPRRWSAGRSPGLAERAATCSRSARCVRDAAGEVVTDLRAASIRAGVRGLAAPARRGARSTCTRCTGPSPTSAARWRRPGRRWPSCSARARCATSAAPTSSSRTSSAREAIAPRRRAAAAVLAAAPRGRAASCCRRCLRPDIGVIVYSPMASGLLSGSMTRERAAALPADDWRRPTSSFHGAGAVARPGGGRAACASVAARLGASPGEVAIAWTLANPAVTGAIVGFRRADAGRRAGRRRRRWCWRDADLAELDALTGSP